MSYIFSFVCCCSKFDVSCFWFVTAREVALLFVS